LDLAFGQVLDTRSIIFSHYSKRLTTNVTRAQLRASQKETNMKSLLTLTVLLLCVLSIGVHAQDLPSSTSNKTATKQTKRGPIFRATKDQINQAQAILKSRGFYAGEQVGKLDEATREGLRKYQQAEGLKVTGTLNKITLEKMKIALTDKQKTM
jgi:peptidoglycan hydrolase-like protein with peptidoglycan-binding domain